MRKTPLLLVLAALIPAAAARAGTADARPYRFEVTVERDGQASTARVEVAPGETGSDTNRREIPYRQVASADPDEDGIPAPTIDVARSVTVSPVERDGALRISAEIRLSDLVGLDRLERGGRAVDLPDVRTLDLKVDDQAMSRSGEGWTYEAALPEKGCRVRIVASR